MESSFHPEATIQSISPLETEKILQESTGEPRQESDVTHVLGSVKMNRWAGLSAAMIMMVCNGLTYTYAVYSEFMKSKLHYSQEQTDDLGAAKDFGAFVGLISGLCYFLFPPWVSIFIGAAMHFLGYSMILLTLTGRIEASFWLLCFYSAIATGGDNWVDTACIMTSLESFKDFKGTAVGILKSQLGLSAAIFVTAYEAFLESEVTNFLVLITVVPTVVYLGLAFLIRPHNASHKEITEELDTIQRFKVVSALVLVLGIFLMGFMTLEEAFDLKDTGEKLVAAVMLILLGLMLLAPLFHKPLDRLKAIFSVQPPFALESDFKHRSVVKDQLDEESIMDEERTHLTLMQELSRLPAVTAPEDSLELTELPSQNDGHALYHSSKDGLCSIDFWLLTFAISSGAGSGLAVINNFAQICKAVKSDTVDAFVGIISIWSCFGRLVSGYGSDLMMNAGIPRPICLIISQTAMCLCCLLLSTGFVPFLFIGSAIVGLAYGSFWTLAPTVISEVFGLRRVATLYKFLGLGPTVASYLLSAKVLGYLYDKEALVYREETHDLLEENVCYGKRCFEFGLLSLASVCFVGAVACSWFTYRTKKVYFRRGHIRLLTSI